MADRDEDELEMAIRMSLQGSPPEAKRSKPRDEESPEQRTRRLQREILASAAEKRIRASEGKCVTPPRPVVKTGEAAPAAPVAAMAAVLPSPLQEEKANREEKGEELPEAYAEQLFSMVFGNGVSSGILAQWSNQGINSKGVIRLFASRAINNNAYKASPLGPDTGLMASNLT